MPSGARAPRVDDRVGRILGGRYRLLGIIGAGASGQVFLAEDVQLHRRVAVKVLHPALAADEAFLRRFRAEARAAAALSHPNLMAVYDWGEDDEGPYLVLEHLAGGSLRAMLDTGHRLSHAQALLVGLEAARALDVAHRRGIVHRDIKPANILFGEDGRLRIADFGLARALSEASQTESGGGLVGTARYAAPEQARGSLIDARADVYSLGLVLAEGVTGTVPLTGDSAMQTLVIRQDTPVPFDPALGALAPLLVRMGQPDVDARPDAAQVATELLSMARLLDGPAPLPLAGSGAPGDEPVTGDELTRYSGGSATGVLPHVEHRRRRWPKVLAALVVLVAAVGGGLVAYRDLATPSARVPLLSGMPLGDARAVLANARAEHPDVTWALSIDRGYNEDVKADVVISQSPAERANLDDGGKVTLLVSDGPPPVGVPSLANMTRAQADAALVGAGLHVGKVMPQTDEAVPAGTVLDWRSGETSKPATAIKGSAVDLVISSGPAPRPVPELRGVALDAAVADLKGRGFVTTEVEVFDDAIEAGFVVSTSPPGGQTAPKGSTIEVRVSKGPDVVEVPDVSQYETLGDAEAALQAAGLYLSGYSGSSSRATKPFDSDPRAGTVVRRGTGVFVYLRRG